MRAATSLAPDRRAWTAGGLRKSSRQPDGRTAADLLEAEEKALPPMQLELFLEAGANLAAQAAHAGASAEMVQGILRRAGEQAAVAADLKGEP